MRIKKASLGKPIRYPLSHGDLWATTWADDDELYTVSDDSLGFNRSCNSWLAVHRLSGDTPHELKAVTVNPMYEYGRWCAPLMEDGAFWKANSLICVDGVLYLSVSRHLPCNQGPFMIQEAWDASIVKSLDHGKTWSPEVPRAGHSMFPGHTFGTPSFVQYGKDGDPLGADHEADKYVYAVSSTSGWNNGLGMVFGRVRRERISRLETADWEFIHGFDKQGAPRWRARHDTAWMVFYAPGKTGMSGIHYIAGLDLYILPQWHYTRLDLPEDAQRWKDTRLEFYQSPSPWGPWALFHAQDFEPEGWYNPCIPAKFVSPDGKSLWLFVSGDWKTGNTMDGYYGLFMMPMELELEA